MNIIISEGMSKKRINVDFGNDCIEWKRAKPINKEANVSDTQMPDQRQRETTGPYERQLLSFSQFYNSMDDEEKQIRSRFPGPAGLLDTFKYRMQRVGNVEEGNDPKINSKMNESDEPTKILKDVSSSATILADNKSWKVMQEYYKLSVAEENDLIKKINIKMIEMKMRRLRSGDQRETVPFLAAVITNHDLPDAMTEDQYQQSCFCLTLEDMTGKINAVVDGDSKLSLGHLIEVGTCIILRNFKFHKMYWQSQLCVTKDMIACIAVNRDNCNIQLSNDVPDGFTYIQQENNVVIFHQSEINTKEIYDDVLQFKKQVFPSRGSSISECEMHMYADRDKLKDNASSLKATIENVEEKKAKQHQTECLNDWKSTDEKNKTSHEKSTIAPEGLLGVCGEFEDSHDHDDMNVSLVQVIEKTEKESSFSLDQQKSKQQNVTVIGKKRVFGECQEEEDN